MNPLRKAKRMRRRGLRGFTLIELMIVVVIIAILAAIAYPAYQNQVRKTRRSDGMAMLMETAQQLERCYSRFGSYNDAACNVTLPANSGEEFYVIDGAPTAAAFALTATPQGDQANDAECGTLTLSNTGQQGSQGATADANGCW